MLLVSEFEYGNKLTSIVHSSKEGLLDKEYYAEWNANANWHLVPFEKRCNFLSTIVKESGLHWNSETLKIEDLNPKFKDGDILISEDSDITLVFKEYIDFAIFTSYCSTTGRNDNWRTSTFRHASSYEEDRFYKRLKEQQGLRWNAEKKQVEEAKWKPQVGETFYYMNLIFECRKGVFGNDPSQGEIIEAGNCFQTRELCERAIEVTKKTLGSFHEENE